MNEPLPWTKEGRRIAAENAARSTMPISTVVKLLRIAIGYGSRTERIQRMLNATDPAVAITARSLMAQGYLDRDAGTINLEVK